MDWFIVVVGVLLLALATPIALWWWWLARKAAPYVDEKGKGPVSPKQDDNEVVIIQTPGEQPRR